MALNNTTAEALGASIAAKLVSLTNEQKADPDFMWKEVCKLLYAGIKNDAQLNGQANGLTGTGPAGGPLPITNQPVTGSLQ